MSIYGRCNTMNGNQTRTYPYTQEMFFRPTKQHNNTTGVYWMTQFHAISRVTSVCHRSHDQTPQTIQLTASISWVLFSWIGYTPKWQFHVISMMKRCEHDAQPLEFWVHYFQTTHRTHKDKKDRKIQTKLPPELPANLALENGVSRESPGMFCFFLFLMGLLRSLNLNLLGNLVFLHLFRLHKPYIFPFMFPWFVKFLANSKSFCFSQCSIHSFLQFYTPLSSLASGPGGPGGCASRVSRTPATSWKTVSMPPVATGSDGYGQFDGWHVGINHELHEPMKNGV